MVMEYCPSMDLFTYVAEQATVGDEPLCHALFLQIVNTLNYMHETHKMAHLDIKLENIVVDEHYLLRLIDFAYCERVDARMHISKGTERYFAPEVARIFYQRQVWYPNSLIEKPSYIAEKADVFSIGILLFTMFFGTPPFRQNDPQREPLLHYLCSNDLATAEIFFQHHELTRIPNMKGRISLGLKRLLVKLLPFKPESRPKLSDVIAHDEWVAKGANGKMLP